jgi:hypothetical protein
MASASIGLRPERSGTDLGHHCVTVGDEHGLAGRGETHILVSLFFRIFRPTARIAAKVATGSFFRQG